MHVRVALSTHSEAATEALAATLGPALAPGDIVALDGALGTGKTAFVRGLVRGRGGAMRVKSPTYALAHSYEMTPPVHHLDLYRLPDEAAVYSAGLEAYLEDEAALCCVEWSERAPGVVLRATLHVVLEDAADGPDARHLKLRVPSDRSALVALLEGTQTPA